MNTYRAQSRQRGVALIVSLIMLLAITLVVVSASNLVQSNLKVVQNMESRDMVRFAAYAALEEAISSGRFTATLTPCLISPVRSPTRSVTTSMVMASTT